ncbi:hypothetical protein BN889_06680 [Pseudomonas aeruginosa PA38182]|nr:hypothetical protein BN889_06680 [Pseudomonas aeruginosa PA38182]
MLEVGGEDGVASLGEFGELLRIAVGLAGGGALEQFGVFGGAQGGDFAGEVLQVFQALALLLVFAGGLGEVEDQAVEQQVAALRALFGFGPSLSLVSTRCRPGASVFSGGAFGRMVNSRLGAPLLAKRTSI